MRFFADAPESCINCGYDVVQDGDTGWVHVLTRRAVCPTATYASPALA